MTITKFHLALKIVLLLGGLSVNLAIAEPLLGLTLSKSTASDVQNLIAKSGAQVTEDKQLLSRTAPNSPGVSTGRVIRIKGGSLLGVREYLNASFIFNPNGILERYILNYSLDSPEIFNERYQAVSSEYSNTKSSSGYALFATDIGAITLSENRNTNVLMEDWQINSMLAIKPTTTTTQANTLLGLTLTKSTISDVQALIKQGRANITDDSKDSSGQRTINIQGGSLDGVPLSYLNGGFTFNANGFLKSYYFIYTLNSSIYNRRVQDLSSDYKVCDKLETASASMVRFSVNYGKAELTDNRAKNVTKEYWEEDPNFAIESGHCLQNDSTMMPIVLCVGIVLMIGMWQRFRPSGNKIIKIASLIAYLVVCLVALWVSFKYRQAHHAEIKFNSASGSALVAIVFFCIGAIISIPWVFNLKKQESENMDGKNGFYDYLIIGLLLVIALPFLGGLFIIGGAAAGVAIILIGWYLWTHQGTLDDKKIWLKQKSIAETPHKQWLQQLGDSPEGRVQAINQLFDQNRSAVSSSIFYGISEYAQYLRFMVTRNLRTMRPPVYRELLRCLELVYCCHTEPKFRNDSKESSAQYEFYAWAKFGLIWGDGAAQIDNFNFKIKGSDQLGIRDGQSLIQYYANQKVLTINGIDNRLHNYFQDILDKHDEQFLPAITEKLKILLEQSGSVPNPSPTGLQL